MNHLRGVSFTYDPLKGLSQADKTDFAALKAKHVAWYETSCIGRASIGPAGEAGDLQSAKAVQAPKRPSDPDAPPSKATEDSEELKNQHRIESQYTMADDITLVRFLMADRS